jgi:hypothetical protein
MPYEPRPFYKAGRRTWYVEVNRVQHKLGKHPAGQPDPRKGKDGLWIAPPDVLQQFRKVMATAHSTPVPEPKPEHPHVATILDEYFGWLTGRVEEGTKAPRTLSWYGKYLISFLRFLRSLEGASQDYQGPPALTIDCLEPIHVY